MVRAKIIFSNIRQPFDVQVEQLREIQLLSDKSTEGD